MTQQFGFGSSEALTAAATCVASGRKMHLYMDNISIVVHHSELPAKPHGTMYVHKKNGNVKDSCYPALTYTGREKLITLEALKFLVAYLQSEIRVEQYIGNCRITIWSNGNE